MVDSTPGPAAGRPARLADRAVDLWSTHTRRPALWWTDHVSYRLGAWIAAVATDTSVTPNGLTLLGLMVHALGATLVLLWTPATIATALTALVIWQVAYALDCADGLLARSRGTTSDFGAWLDQVVDFVSHAMVFIALTPSVARSLDLPGDLAAGISIALFATHVLQGYAVSLKARSGIERRGLSQGRRGIVGMIARVLHLTDYGLFLFVVAILLLAPSALLAFLIVASVMSVAAVAVQLAGYRNT